MKNNVRSVPIHKPDPSAVMLRQCRNTGHALLSPKYIFPPRRIGRVSFAIFVQAFETIERSPGVSRDACSWHIFVDGTTNRNTKFMAPLVRFAQWNRSLEYASKRTRSWPLIDIAQHILSIDEQSVLNGLLLDLDRSFLHIDFAEGGLITDRQTPCQCFPDCDESKGNWSRFLRVYRTNNCQNIELTLGEYGTDNKIVEKSVRTITKYIQELCTKSPSKLPYVEAYGENPREATVDWRFRPHRPK